MPARANGAVIVVLSLTLVMIVAAMYVMWIRVMADPVYRDRVEIVRVPEYGASPTEVRVSQAPPTAPDRPYVPSRARVDFSQVGFVHKPDRTVMMPLYGRPAPRNPSRWQYFVRANDADIRIGARCDGKMCLEDVGCPELQSNDTIQVPEVAEGDLVATIYDTSASTAMEGIRRY